MAQCFKYWMLKKIIVLWTYICSQLCKIENRNSVKKNNNSKKKASSFQLSLSVAWVECSESKTKCRHQLNAKCCLPSKVSLSPSVEIADVALKWKRSVALSKTEGCLKSNAKCHPHPKLQWSPWVEFALSPSLKKVMLLSGENRVLLSVKCKVVFFFQKHILR